MTFPIRHSVTRLPYEGDGDDGFGNTESQFGPGVTVGVFAIAPHTFEEGSNTRTETEVADLDVFMPKATVSAKDRFVVSGDTYDVVAVKDWTQGFHGWEPGIVVELRRVK